MRLSLAAFLVASAAILGAPAFAQDAGDAADVDTMTPTSVREGAGTRSGVRVVTVARARRRAGGEAVLATACIDAPGRRKF